MRLPLKICRSLRTLSQVDHLHERPAYHVKICLMNWPGSYTFFSYFALSQGLTWFGGAAVMATFIRIPGVVTPCVPNVDYCIGVV